MKVGAIIQARLGSTRLPGKVLFPFTTIGGQKLSFLSYMILRVAQAKYLDEVIIACPEDDNEIENRVHAELCNLAISSEKLSFYYGPENDVMHRVAGASYFHALDLIVDITSDCPFVDPQHINDLVKLAMEISDGSYAYVSNIHPRTWPDGCDIQVYSASLFQKLNTFTPKTHESREYTGYALLCEILNNKNHTDTSILHKVAPKERYWPELGITLDTEEDYQFFKLLNEKWLSLSEQVDGVNKISFAVENLIDYLRVNPQYIINNKVQRKDPKGIK